MIPNATKTTGVELGTIADLTPDAKNANRGTQRGLAMLEDSLRRHGAGRSILVDKHGRVIAGNKTLESAASIGLEDVVIVKTDGTKIVAVQRTDIDLDTPEGRRLAVADNRTSEVGLDWDTDALSNLLADGLDTEGLFSAEELSDLLAVEPEPKDAPDAQLDRAEELRAQWGTERGQVWRVGPHRLMCGDSTDAGDVATLMDGAKATAVVTSPPYTDQREYKIGSFDWDALLDGAFDQAISACPAGDLLFNLGPSHKDGKVDFYWNNWLVRCDAKGFPLFGMYVWDKGSGMPGEWNGRLAPSHEFIFHFRNASRSAQKWIDTNGSAAKRGGGGKRFRNKDGSLKESTAPELYGQLSKIPDSVIRCGRESARGIHTQSHPAVYPVEFAAFLLQTWTVACESILDPFLGSGTTMVAAEQLGRVCYGMEIEPRYVAVSLQRLADMGLTPERA